MNKKDKVKFVIDTLNNLYPDPPIPLKHKDPYTLLISVLLSAQSTDARVNLITPILFARADNPYDMIKLSVEEIREIFLKFEGLKLYLGSIAEKTSRDVFDYIIGVTRL